MVYRFGEHHKKADAWKPVSICFTRIGKTIPQYIRCGGRRGESAELRRVGGLWIIYFINWYK